MNRITEATAKMVHTNLVNSVNPVNPVNPVLFFLNRHQQIAAKTFSRIQPGARPSKTSFGS